jgi:hypothetical protein
MIKKPFCGKIGAWQRYLEMIGEMEKWSNGRIEKNSYKLRVIALHLAP